MDIKFDSSWSIFLDRDGVINRKIDGDYVREWSTFEFLEGSKEAISKLSNNFNHMIIFTNQRGIGRGLFSHEDLENIHNKMDAEIKSNGGRITDIFYCEDANYDSPNRKPNTGMAKKAKEKYSDLDFSKSIMIGDSIHDMEFGKRIGSVCIYISNKDHKNKIYDYRFDSLKDFVNELL